MRNSCKVLNCRNKTQMQRRQFRANYKALELMPHENRFFRLVQGIL